MINKKIIIDFEGSHIYDKISRIFSSTARLLDLSLEADAIRYGEPLRYRYKIIISGPENDIKDFISFMEKAIGLTEDSSIHLFDSEEVPDSKQEAR